MTLKARIAVLFALLAFALTTAVSASGGRSAVSKTIENSMLVTGTIDIEKDGTVDGYLLDQPEKLPPAVQSLMAQAIPHWRFEPVRVDDQVVRARSKMGVRVIARRLEDGGYRLRVNGASFGDSDGKAADASPAGKKKSMDPPRYPAAAYESNVTGTVYLLIKIDPTGDVVDAFVEQVNLTVLGNENQMVRARKLLSAPSIDVAKRRWTFNPPSQEQLGEDGYYVARVPISYVLDEVRGFE